jgi:hypothetical protein
VHVGDQRVGQALVVRLAERARYLERAPGLAPRAVGEAREPRAARGRDVHERERIDAGRAGGIARASRRVDVGGRARRGGDRFLVARHEVVELRAAALGERLQVAVAARGRHLEQLRDHRERAPVA